jgi:hypothetical protein
MTIKISQLGNLTSFTDTTLFPVVNTANAFITVKSTGLTLKNYIFSNIGTISATGNVTAGNLSATYLTGTLLTASQPNITSVGTLSNLSVTGNISGSNLTGTLLTTAQPNITSLGNLLTTNFDQDINCAGLVNTDKIEADLFFHGVNYVNVANTYTYSLSTTTTDNVLIILTSNPTATINMPDSPLNGQVTRFSANANVVLATGTGNVSPSFAGANLLVSSMQYVYNSQYSTWFRI